MAAPVINSITFDKATYNPGDTVRATVSYHPGTSPVVHTLTGSILDETTSETGTFEGQYTINHSDPTTITLADDGNHNWVKQSDDGSAAVFTTTA